MTDTCSPDDRPAVDPQAQALDARFAPGPGKHVLFFGDPMCSWCWGFAPDLEQLAAHAQGRAQFHVVMGGLRPGTTETWDEAMRGYIRHHWQDVHAKTGQPFDFARFDDATCVHDTEPSCRAVVAVRGLDTDRTLAMYEALQRAFYAQNRDITDTAVLAELAQHVGVDRDAFLTAYQSADARNQVEFDFQRTQAFGVQGFPSVLCAEDGRYGFLALGYRPYSTMHDDFDAWLAA